METLGTLDRIEPWTKLLSFASVAAYGGTAHCATKYHAGAEPQTCRQPVPQTSPIRGLIYHVEQAAGPCYVQRSRRYQLPD